jgi:hypothetical protein
VPTVKSSVCQKTNDARAIRKIPAAVACGARIRIIGPHRADRFGRTAPNKSFASPTPHCSGRCFFYEDCMTAPDDCTRKRVTHSSSGLANSDGTSAERTFEKYHSSLGLSLQLEHSQVELRHFPWVIGSAAMAGMSAPGTKQTLVVHVLEGISEHRCKAKCAARGRGMNRIVCGFALRRE